MRNKNIEPDHSRCYIDPGLYVSGPLKNGETPLIAKILLVEDDVSLQKSLAYILKKEQFDVHTARTGEDAVTLAVREKPDVILLDLLLPGIDGFEVCRRLKNNPASAQIFIIMLTGKRLVSEITEGLSLYADDYVTKPFEPAILIARIHAMLRRSTRYHVIEKKRLEYEGLTIDLIAREVNIDGRMIQLNRTEFDLLVLLAQNPNVVLTREQVLNHIRHHDLDITERVVDYQVSLLRKKMGPQSLRIETVRGVGYKFRPTPPDSD